MRPGIDIVVVNYHTPNDLRRFCVSYIDHFPETEATLHIVNNECLPSDDYVAKGLIPEIPGEVEYYSFRENFFYSGAVNRVGQAGSREIIAVFNADCRLRESTIDTCYRALMDNPDWGCVGPLQYGDYNEVTHGGIFGTPDAPKHRGWKELVSDRFRDVNDGAVTISGSAYFTKRSVWDELYACKTYRDLYPNVEGPWLPTTHYYEETWFSYHMKAHGYRCVYLGTAEMIHRWHKASEPGGWADRQFSISRKMFRDMCDSHGIIHD